jgi:hypothetical protein
MFKCQPSERGLKGIEPLIPPRYDGLELPLTDLTAVFDWLLPQFANGFSNRSSDGLIQRPSKV